MIIKFSKRNFMLDPYTRSSTKEWQAVAESVVESLGPFLLVCMLRVNLRNSVEIYA
jgi:hypothetical protein